MGFDLVHQNTVGFLEWRRPLNANAIWTTRDKRINKWKQAKKKKVLLLCSNVKTPMTFICTDDHFLSFFCVKVIQHPRVQSKPSA